MSSPEALDEKPIELRREKIVKLEISVSSEASVVDVDGPRYCIRVPRTNSVKRSGSHDDRIVLDLTLEVRGATTGRPLMSACHACSRRDHSSSPCAPIIDFVAQEDLIKVKSGKAFVDFRFLCYSAHQGTMDKEYRCASVASSESIAYVSPD